ncbi:MAG: hypothetical protein JO219_04700 [Candidatus Eremiobacteraeota bacterium]|nr:hypothetical protein [Candidatus Eremiobacteraeota bacterium]MBV8367159.1 hypothetical protein [Candidatus Eremiobacteraeota bacterium]
MSVARALTLIWMVSLALSFTSAARADDASPAPARGVAYDEIRWRAVDMKPLAPGSFASDRETLMRRVVPAERYPDVDGNVLGNLGADLMTTRPQFVAIYRYSYLGDWVRVDDLLAQTAAISRPDKGETIFLNLHAKTYRTTAAAVKPGPTVAPTASPNAAPDNYRIDVSAGGAPALSLDGLPTTGMTLDGRLTTVHATDSCIEMEGSMHWLLYQAQDIPTIASEPVNFSEPLAIFHCTFDTAHATVKPTSTNLVLYLSVSLSVTAGPIQVRPIISVIERGNVVKLSQADAALFDIPADFLPQGSVSLRSDS